MNRRSFLLGGSTAALTALVAACGPKLAPVVPSTPSAASTPSANAASTSPAATAAANTPSTQPTATSAPARPTAAPPTSTPQTAPTSSAALTGPLRTSGAKLLDASGNDVQLTGVSWFGFETETFAPHGLHARNVDDMLDQIAATGFNTIRLPFSNQLFDPASKVNGVNYQLNPKLQDLSGPDLLDHVIDAAGKRHLWIILDRHRPDAHAQSELWYTDKVNEDRWLQDWVALAKKYRGNHTVIGADLHNEPHGPATWGDSNVATDWRLAAERGGNAILDVNPDWLILVQGIEHYNNVWYWWGGNLMGAGDNPVRLKQPDKLVYSPHDYGPEEYAQSWFKDPGFPGNLPDVWKKQWAYLHLGNVAPVHVGEFGGRSVGSDPEGRWQTSLLKFLKDNKVNYTYWCWNPDSGDTGGMLMDDWLTVIEPKVQLLSLYQFPLPGATAAVSAGKLTSAYKWPVGQPTPAPSH